MKTMICQAAIAVALISLVGCGLKGPLYFPPENKPASGNEQHTDGTTESAPSSAIPGDISSKPATQPETTRTADKSTSQ